MSMPTNICCEHAFLVEENTRLKSQVEKELAIKSKKKKNKKKKNKKKKTVSSLPLNAIVYEQEGEKSSNVSGVAPLEKHC